MYRKIINIVVFAIAITACILAVIFAAKFDDEKVTQYKAVCVLHANQQGQEVLNQVVNATPENLAECVEQSQNFYATLDDELRAEKKVKENFYDYVATLQALNADNFEEFKAHYPGNVQEALDVFDTTHQYEQEFASINSYEDLTTYLISLEQNYNATRQNYLKKEELRNSLKTVQDNLVAISEYNSKDKKAEELQLLQNDINNFQTMSGKLFDPAVFLFYILLAITLGAMVVFALINVVTNFKTSYKGLLGILALLAIFGISYAIASPELSDVFIKLQITPETARAIEAGCYTCYTVFFIAILAIIVSPIVNAIRTKRSLKKV